MFALLAFAWAMSSTRISAALNAIWPLLPLLLVRGRDVAGLAFIIYNWKGGKKALEQT